MIVSIELLIYEEFKPNMYKEKPKLQSKNCFLLPNIFLENKVQIAYKKVLFEKTRTMGSIIHCFLLPNSPN